MNPFSEKLKHLRGPLTVEDLAAQCGVAASSIYKMESTAKVRWQTVERAYGRLFRDAQEHLLMLVLWALEQTERKQVLYQAAETAKCLLRDEQIQLDGSAMEISRLTHTLSPPQAGLLLEFVRRYAENEPTRQMAAAWINAFQ
jgi:hypothetical protein